MLSDILTAEDIADCVSRSAFLKARAYWAEHRVFGVTISEDSTEIRAKVRGSERQPYFVDIKLKLKGGEIDTISGDCTCPMGFNCKHVAATLFEVLYGDEKRVGGMRPVNTPAAPSPRPPTAPDLPPEVAAWLDRMGKAERGDEYPPDIVHRLLYILQPQAAGRQTPSLAVSLLSVRLLKDGAFSDKVSQVDPQGFDTDRAPKFYRDVDLAILPRLQRERQSYGYPGHSLQSIELLRQIVETGRAFWLEHARAPLRWGEERQGRIAWRLASSAGVEPTLTVDGAVALNAEPPVYIDEAAGLVGQVDVGAPARLAHRLLAAPAIAPNQVAEVARRLGMTLPGVRSDLLPTPPEPALTIKEDPIPVLRLGLGRSAYNYHYYGAPSATPVAALGFRYGPIELARSGPAGPADAVHDGRLYRISRRPSREKEAVNRLQDCGFVEAKKIYPYLAQTHAKDLTFASGPDWLHFLDLRLGDLEAQGFEIHIDKDFPYRLAKPSSAFDAEFESSGIDWFELSLGVEIDGERHDLVPSLVALVGAPTFDSARFEALAQTDAQIYLPLADGRLLAVAASRFLPLLLALHTLSLDGLTFGEGGRLRLARASAAPLLALETQDFVFRGDESLRRLASLLQIRGLPDPVLPETFKAQLRPYQAQGVAWLDLLRDSGLGGILADDMGLGKTVQVLALLALEKARGGQANPTLIVAPTSLMTNWFNEAHKFAPDLKVLVLHGVGRKQAFAAIAEHDVVLTTYPLIARDHDVLLTQDWHMAILDEAQTIKNPNAATTRWLAGVKAKHRFCLTGTPMENHLGELWSLMSFANPGYLGDKTAFSRTWRTPIEKRGDIARSTMLARRVKPFLLRRTKGEVATELPPKTEIIDSIALEGRQRDLYDSIRIAMSDKVRQAIRERGLAKSHIIVLEALLKLRQACCDPRLLKLRDKIERPSAKLERLMDMVVELLSEGRKIIVFSQFTSMLDLIQSRFDGAGIAYSVLTGQTRDRAAAINGFQNGRSDVFLVSLKAGGVGLNLTAADTVIIFDPWWNPAVEEQAIDRAYRIGQDKAVFVYRLVATETIEEKMDELKARKRALADSLFDQDGRIGSALTEDDVAALFEA